MHRIDPIISGPNYFPGRVQLDQHYSIDRISDEQMKLLRPILEVVLQRHGNDHRVVKVRHLANSIRIQDNAFVFDQIVTPEMLSRIQVICEVWIREIVLVHEGPIPFQLTTHRVLQFHSMNGKLFVTFVQLGPNNTFEHTIHVLSQKYLRR